MGACSRCRSFRETQRKNFRYFLALFREKLIIFFWCASSVWDYFACVVCYDARMSAHRRHPRSLLMNSSGSEPSHVIMWVVFVYVGMTSWHDLLGGAESGRLQQHCTICAIWFGENALSIFKLAHEPLLSLRCPHIHKHPGCTPHERCLSVRLHPRPFNCKGVRGKSVPLLLLKSFGGCYCGRSDSWRYERLFFVSDWPNTCGHASIEASADSSRQNLPRVACNRVAFSFIRLNAYNLSSLVLIRAHWCIHIRTSADVMYGQNPPEPSSQPASRRRVFQKRNLGLVENSTQASLNEHENHKANHTAALRSTSV